MMEQTPWARRRGRIVAGGRRAATGFAYRSAFTLIELLTVVFIISLLIGILIPSVNAARNAAKKATTATTINVIKVALEMFKNDNESNFRKTNGYPPSFAHPRISGYTFDSFEGRFPFYDPVSESSPPVVYGAHWLPAMLMGADNLGYVRRSSVPEDLRDEPWCWYPTQDVSTACTNPTRTIDRAPFYLDPGNTKTRATKDLPGRPPPSDVRAFPDWDLMGSLPVIIDAFGQPILYYVANKHGRKTNMVEEMHLQDNDMYNRTAMQEQGVPYYFHQDNEGFTGTVSSDPAANEALLGWQFGGRPGGHAIGTPGDKLLPADLILVDNRDTFARYIIDRKIYAALSASTASSAPLRPVNADTYLLISAGPDGRFGTVGDVSNLPKWPD